MSMRRADRLFQIIQVLRRSSRPVTAARLAEELEVSPRTIYRDMQDLIGQRVPIDGEAGLGYVIARDYDMPPLMLSPPELEAMALGAEWVIKHADAVLSHAARDVVAKIAAVIPDALRPHMVAAPVGAKPAGEARPDGVDLAGLRAAIRDGRKLRLLYRSETGDESDRIVSPVLLGYSEAGRLLIAWCELRADFRHFRTDRMIAAETLLESTGLRSGELRRRWEQWHRQQGANAPSASSTERPKRSPASTV